MVACNPRDAEAAHRADVADLQIATGDAVTCPSCIARMRTSGHRARRDRDA